VEYEDARLWGTGGPLLEDIEARSRMPVSLDIPEGPSCHGRGVRIAHRLTVHVDANPKFEILATALFDIVSTVAQYQPFANPKNSVGPSHWRLPEFETRGDTHVQIMYSLGHF